MTSDPPTTKVSAPCPTCGVMIETEADRDETGLLHARAVSLTTLREHMDCDLWKISICMSQTAAAQSKIAVPTIFQED